MRHRLSLATFLVAIAPLWVGCTSEDSFVDDRSSEEDETVVEESYGALIASYTHDRSGGDQAVQFQAQVVEARGLRAAPALKALEVWLPPRHLDVGECEFQNRQSLQPHPDNTASLHLLDVGDIEVTTPTEQIHLSPMRLPDLLASFYGVIYDSTWGDHRLSYEADEQWSIWAPGADSTGPLEARFTTPAPMMLVAANGDEIAEYQREVLIDDNQDLELVWSHLSDDDVFIELQTGQGSRAMAMTCRSEDVGAFSGPASKIRELSRHGDNVDLSIRRVRSDSMPIEGVESANHHFSVADHLQLRWR